MVAIGEHEENILQDWNVELPEEDIRSLSICLGHIIHELKAHRKTRVLDLAIVVFAGPHARVDYELELRSIKFEQGWETV